MDPRILCLECTYIGYNLPRSWIHRMYYDYIHISYIYICMYMFIFIYIKMTTQQQCQPSEKGSFFHPSKKTALRLSSRTNFVHPSKTGPNHSQKSVFPKIVVSQNGWFIMENPIKMDDLGGKPHYFRKHPNRWCSNCEDPSVI